MEARWRWRMRKWRVYRSGVEGPKRRGRPLGRWEDKMKEYVSERGNEGKWVGVDREGVYGLGEVKIRLTWPPPLGMLPEVVRHQSY